VKRQRNRETDNDRRENGALQALLEKTQDEYILRLMIGFAPEPAEGAAPDGVGH